MTHVGPIGQIHLSTDDVERAVRFWTEQVGLPLLLEVPGQPMAFVDLGQGQRLYLGTPEREEYRSRPVIYFRTDAIGDAQQALAARGVGFDGEPHMAHRTEEIELWLTSFGDPDGNKHLLMEERAVTG